jgi:inner membrane protein
MLLGALAQSIPDIDFISALWNDTASNLLAHRGFTHSILFMLLATIFFGLVAGHYHKQHKIGYKGRLLFFGLQIFIHLFIDLFNSNGLGLLEPFSHRRFSFNTLFVIDPFFSVWSAIGFTALLLLKKQDKRRKYWWKLGVIVPAIYLLYCTIDKLKIDDDIRKILAAQKIKYTDYFSTPTPLNNWLWYIAVKDVDGYYITFRSIFDRKNQLQLHYFPKNDSLLIPIKDHEELQHLLRFSQDYYTVEKWHDTLVFNDLRFGQIVGWHDPKEKFVFHYFLQHPPAANRLVVQRGRFAKWNWQTTQSLIHRIVGE